MDKIVLHLYMLTKMCIQMVERLGTLSDSMVHFASGSHTVSV